MATFKIEIRNRRADGTSNVKIRVTHNGKVRRMPTNIYVTDADITKGRAIKNANVLDQCQALLRECREACNGLGYRIADMSIDELIGNIKAHLMGKERFTLDFIAYGMEKTATMKEGTASTYVSAFNALRRYGSMQNSGGGGKFVSLSCMKTGMKTGMKTKDINLGSLILPCEVFEHFEIADVICGEKDINLFLDEKSIPPVTSGYSSKGFTEQTVIQDFPLRGDVPQHGGEVLWEVVSVVATEGTVPYSARGGF